MDGGSRQWPAPVSGGRRPAAGVGRWLTVAAGGGRWLAVTGPVIGGEWLWVMIGVFWSFHNGKHSFPMGMSDSHGGNGNVLRVKFISGNIIFPGMLRQTFYQT